MIFEKGDADGHRFHEVANPSETIILVKLILFYIWGCIYCRRVWNGKT